MAVTANSIITPQTPQSASVPFGATANTNLIAPTQTTLLMTAGANGGRLTRLEALANATQAASQVQFYRSVDAGTTKTLLRAKAFPAYALTTTSDIPVLDFGFSDDNPLILAAGERIYEASAVTVTGVVGRAEWADY
ncbi:hypothetical protein [Phenylobacterium sp.]|uniref:hypothetical protein n=1 Tax=Phenylobacterium sp. TaxID=1871053 RepID=UPI0025EBC803|nr:hypothetical protein [Phenylobacterium sp.]